MQKIKSFDYVLNKFVDAQNARTNFSFVNSPLGQIYKLGGGEHQNGMKEVIQITILETENSVI